MSNFDDIYDGNAAGNNSRCMNRVLEQNRQPKSKEKER